MSKQQEIKDAIMHLQIKKVLTEPFNPALYEYCETMINYLKTKLNEKPKKNTIRIKNQ
jgi:hypothetical protein